MKKDEKDEKEIKLTTEEANQFYMKHLGTVKPKIHIDELDKAARS